MKIYNLAIRIYRKILQIYWSIFIPMHLKFLGVYIGKNCKFYGFPIVSLGKNSKILINDNVVLCSDPRFTQLGVSHPVILNTSNNAILEIGKDTGISGATIYAHKTVIIGEACLIGADVKIFDTNFHSLKSENRRYNKKENDISSKKVIIGDNCFIGTNAIILKGCNLKKNTVIPAGSIIKELK